MKKYFIITMCFAFVLMLAACSKTSEIPGDNTPDKENEPIPVSQYYEIPEGVSPLTGLHYHGDGRAIIVQIENTIEARPQSGIAHADLIYEMEVESTITRLTAFFLSEYPEKVGPVRSARKQQIHLWSEWDYLFSYFGGSEKEGQNIYEIKEELEINSPDNDGMGSGKEFSRSKDRKSPHNSYLNLSNLIDNTYDYKPERRTIYYDENVEIDGETAEKISLMYRADNKIEYRYNSETNEYERYINGEQMIDIENNQQVAVKNIVVQYANHYKVTDTVYTNIDLIGSGTAEYFTDGIKRTGRWEREDIDSPTMYFDENGEKIPFKPGKTFIQIVRNDTKVITE